MTACNGGYCCESRVVVNASRCVWNRRWKLSKKGQIGVQLPSSVLLFLLFQADFTFSPIRMVATAKQLKASRRNPFIWQNEPNSRRHFVATF
jgi:hypothetical protein